jgi:hypothetical protein
VNVGTLGQPDSVPVVKASTFLLISECLRDIGLDAECAKLGIPIEEIGNVRWAENMIGREYARTLSFGNGAHRRVATRPDQEKPWLISFPTG